MVGIRVKSRLKSGENWHCDWLRSHTNGALNAEAERRVTTGLVTGFDKDRAEGARSALEGERPSQLTNVFVEDFNSFRFSSRMF